MRSELSPDIEATASPAEHPRLNASVQSHQSQGSIKWYIKSDNTGFGPSRTVNLDTTIYFYSWCEGSLKIDGMSMSVPYPNPLEYQAKVLMNQGTVEFTPASPKNGGAKTGTITVSEGTKKFPGTKG
jgi:hypothetical protein